MWQVITATQQKFLNDADSGH